MFGHYSRNRPPLPAATTSRATESIGCRPHWEIISICADTERAYAHTPYPSSAHCPQEDRLTGISAGLPEAPACLETSLSENTWVIGHCVAHEAPIRTRVAERTSRFWSRRRLLLNRGASPANPLRVARKRSFSRRPIFTIAVSFRSCLHKCQKSIAQALISPEGSRCHD